MHRFNLIPNPVPATPLPAQPELLQAPEPVPRPEPAKAPDPAPVLRGSSREMSQLDRLEVKHGVKNYANAVEVKEDIGWRPGGKK